MSKPADELTLAEIGPCEGTGQPWRTGTVAPICPRCHVGYRALNAPLPRRTGGRWTGKVPAHPNMIIWSGRITVTNWQDAHFVPRRGQRFVHRVWLDNRAFAEGHRDVYQLCTVTSVQRWGDRDQDVAVYYTSAESFDAGDRRGRWRFELRDSERSVRNWVREER